MDEEGGSTSSLVFHPPELWGLSYHFRTFKKMYICDILNMEEYPANPDVFSYKNHPVYRVEVLGLVVRRDVKDKSYICALDDGTGVISCCCWKVPYSKYKLGDEQKMGADFPDILRQKMHSFLGGDDAEAEETRCSLGHLLSVRGSLKRYHGRMEIVASDYRHVTDPNAEVARMSELPLLYHLAYDPPFQLPERVHQEVTANKTGQKTKQQQLEDVCGAIRDLVQAGSMTTLSPRRLLQLPSISSLLPQDSVAEGYVRGEANTLLREALHRLEETWGGIGSCIDPHTHPDTFEVLCQRNRLHEVVLQVLQSQCQLKKFAETGCHMLRVLDRLHGTAQYAKLHQRALVFVLDSLEADSSIIRTTNAHYRPVA